MVEINEDFLKERKSRYNRTYYEKHRERLIPKQIEYCRLHKEDISVKQKLYYQKKKALLKENKNDI